MMLKTTVELPSLRRGEIILREVKLTTVQARKRKKEIERETDRVREKKRRVERERELSLDQPYSQSPYVFVLYQFRRLKKGFTFVILREK